MEQIPHKGKTLAALGVAGTLVVAGYTLPGVLPVQYDTVDHEARVVESTSTIPEAVVPEPVLPPKPVVSHVPIPDQVKAIYMSACVAGTPSFRDSLVELIEETELNSVMIDIKDFSGTLSFDPEDAELNVAWQEATCGARDLREFIEVLHEKGIFVIGRITVFQDPHYTSRRPDLAVLKESDGTVWTDYKGLSFIDVGARPYWEYILTLATESYNLGFDELNFDYIRFPSDGNMKDITFPHTGTTAKPVQLETFFAYLHNELRNNPERFSAYSHEGTGLATPTPYLSADLFGMTTTNTDDLSIGQILERAVPYFDFIAPMVYPSHYPNSFLGLGDPNQHPYKVVNYAMEEGVRRVQATTTTVDGFTHERIGTSTPAVYKKPAYDANVLRPWLQDFDYGGDYDVAEVRAQIQATYDAGLHSWMLWAPSNRYTRGALDNAESDGVE